MTILQILAAKPAAQLTRLALQGKRRKAGQSTSFDNRPTWDNWMRR